MRLHQAMSSNGPPAGLDNLNDIYSASESSHPRQKRNPTGRHSSDQEQGLHINQLNGKFRTIESESHDSRSSLQS